MVLSSHPETLLQSITGKYADLQLGSNIFVHTSLFCKLSPFISSMLNTVDTHEMVRLVMPQVELFSIKKMVELIYTGRCFVSHAELLRLNNLLNCLDMSTVLDSLSLNTDIPNDQTVKRAMNEDKYEFVEESDDRILPEEMMRTELNNPPYPYKYNQYITGPKLKSRSEAFDSSLQKRSLRSFKKSRVSAKIQHDEIDSKNLGENLGSEKCLNVGRCKFCFWPMNFQSRFQVANHMFSRHFKNKIYASLRKNQRDCSICRKVFDSRHALARHLGETHELATTLYDEATSGSNDHSQTFSSEQHRNIVRRKEGRKHINDEKPMKKVYWKRIRSSIYSLPIQEQPRTGVSVTVQNNTANAIEDLSSEHLGETHVKDAASYEENVTNVQMRKCRIFSSEFKLNKQPEKPNITDENQVTNMSSRRIRSSICSLLKNEHLRSGVSVEVRNNNIPAIENLCLYFPSSQNPERVCNRDILFSQLTSKLLLHGRNSIPWKVYDEEYSECEMGWVEKGRRKEIVENMKLHSQEKQFFCIWNKFILNNGYIGFVGRIHMSQVVERFIEEEGKQVMDKKLYLQFVSHLILLEVEAALSKNQILRFITKMNKIHM